MNPKQLVCLVTGANRGIGWAIAKGLVEKGHIVFLGARSKDSAETRCRELNSANARALALDVTNPNQVLAARDLIESEHGRIDVLINNAGILLDGSTSPLEVPLAELTFRHLQTADEIAGIVHLRKEIQLVAASGADPTFVAREKKETRRALSPLSSVAAPSSGRFASFR